MNDTLITFDPRTIVADEPPSGRIAPLQKFFWLLALAAGIGCVVANLLIRLVYLPQAGPATFVHISAAGLALHLFGCYIAGAAVGLAPRSKPLLALSVLVLAANVIFLAGLIATGPFTITHIR